MAILECPIMSPNLVCLIIEFSPAVSEHDGVPKVWPGGVRKSRILPIWKVHSQE